MPSAAMPLPGRHAVVATTVAASSGGGDAGPDSPGLSWGCFPARAIDIEKIASSALFYSGCDVFVSESIAFQALDASFLRANMVPCLPLDAGIILNLQ
ncbi:hypothetical protein [Comamonas humi]